MHVYIRIYVDLNVRISNIDEKRQALILSAERWKYV